MTKTKIQIRWADIDQLKHVYNGQYQHYYDTAKTEYFQKVLSLGSSWSILGEGVITAQTLNNYYIPIELDDKIEIRTVMKEIGNKSLKLFQEIVNLENGVIHSDSTSVLVGYNPIEKSTFEIPDTWRTLMTNDRDKSID